MIPLTLANEGVQNTIVKVTGTPKIKKHLENLGFVTGSDITIISSISGNIIVNVKNTRIALSKEMAQKIMI